MGTPPESSLDWLIGSMKGGGLLPSALGTLLNSLFGSTEGTGNPFQLESGKYGSRQDGGPRYQQGSPPPNTNVHTRIEAATAAARRCNPNVDYQLVIASAPQPKPCINVMSLKRAGCFDYLFFERCSNDRCSFKHNGKIDKAKIDGAIETIRPGLTNIVELYS